MTKREKIANKATELLANEPNGIRYSILARLLIEELPDIANNTIHGTLCNPELKYFKNVFKPEKGLFMHVKFRETDSASSQIPVVSRAIREEDFYESFAIYLVSDLEECTKAIELGGNKFKEKWGTPDVIGVKKARPSDIISFETEIVSAEIKLDTNNLITAFGQACSYKLFSHKSYLVIPKQSRNADISRLDSLCIIFGIGLILYDCTDPQNPNYEIKSRSSVIPPDMFYVNRYIKDIADELLG